MTILSDDEFRQAAEAALAHAKAFDARSCRQTAAQAGPWYVVRAVGKTDAVALDWLKRLDIETYYPMIMQMRPVPHNRMSAKQRREGASVMRPQLAPLLPRYIFARLEMARVEWRQVFSCAGIGGMACAADGAAPLRVADREIAKIMEREQGGAIPESDKARFLFGVGERVRVTQGPFASFIGLVEKGNDPAIGELDPETRIRIALDIFGRPTPLDLEIAQVEKIDQPPKQPPC